MIKAQIQHPAPDFTVEAALADGSIGEIHLADYRGHYVVLFFYPLDFTFVCPTEIYAFADRSAEFEQRNCALLGVSVDSVHAHLAWRRTPRDEGGIGAIPFPLLSDLDKSIARVYGVLLDQPAVALRGVFIIDREGIVRSMQVNDLPLGRNVDEILRLLDAAQFHEQYGEVCPANWQRGAPGMTATLEGVKQFVERQADQHEYVYA
jgi:peroxiredoxin (alkyl hydroperoxide reductase subunit C)